MKNKQAELIKKMTDRELHINLLITQLLLLTVSVIAVWIVFDRTSDFLQLFAFSWTDIGIGAGGALLIFLSDVIQMKVLPKETQDDGGVNQRIFQSLPYPMVPAAALLIAVSEEVLFRGVLQANAGLFWASVIFACVHYRYLFNPYLFMNVMAASFFIGFVFEWTGSLTACIFMHFLLDCMLGLLIKWKKSE